MKIRIWAVLSTFISIFVSCSVLAHPGHHSHSVLADSLLSGLIHPVTGVDHLIMLAAFGVILGCIEVSRYKKMTLAAVALSALMVGLTVGQGVGYSAIVEPMIIVSLFMVSLAVWLVFSPSQKRVNTAIYASIGMMFFHGYAHGVEATSQIAQFAAGMLISAGLLMTVGSALGYFAKTKWLSVGVALASALFLLVV
ncbi:HupE/UreJ family protein [Thaumasiovibrio sp. DFM-14]|uniref:HupE/UreJ family protein n=1 Tax=Thaumasiovibrio sp. DFM-14 TaxID=3384792 RepID=UPI0039A3BFA6